MDVLFLKSYLFGISIAPEYFVSKFKKVLNGIGNCIPYVDDILIFGRNHEEYDRALETVLEYQSRKGITINKEKSCFSVDRVTYLGYILSEEGISVDSE